MSYYVYELIDPRTKTPGYIGITGDLKTRLLQHLGGYDGNQRKKDWIQQIKNGNCEVQMNVIETVNDEKEARIRERYWIEKYLAEGVFLYNAQLVNFSNQPTKILTELDKVQVGQKEQITCITLTQRRTESIEYADLEYPIEYLAYPGYLDDEFADWLDDMEIMEGRSFTEEDIRASLDLVTLSKFFIYSGDHERKAVANWYKNHFVNGGRFENDQPTLSLTC